MNYGGGPYVLMMLSRTKEAMGEGQDMATKATTTTHTKEEATNPDITNTATKATVTAITNRTQEVLAEIAVLAWEQYAVSAVSLIVASSDQSSSDLHQSYMRIFREYATSFKPTLNGMQSLERKTHFSGSEITSPC